MNFSDPTGLCKERDKINIAMLTAGANVKIGSGTTAVVVIVATLITNPELRSDLWNVIVPVLESRITASDNLKTNITNVINSVIQANDFKDNLKDKEENPADWEVTGSSTIPSTKKGNFGGTSTETEWTNSETGDQIYEHELRNKGGRLIEDPHYRPYPKQ